MRLAWLNTGARHYVYDGSWPGLLSVVFTLFNEKRPALSVVRDRAQVADLFHDVREVATEEAQATRVQSRARSLLGVRRMRDLRLCHLAERAEVDRLLVELLTIAFTGGAVNDPRDLTVLGLRQWRKHVSHEKHQMEAFVRFQENTDGVWTATIAPAYNVLPLIAPHFRKRYADMEWVIADTLRGYGLHHRAGQVAPVQFVHDQEPLLPAPHIEAATNESAYVALWKTYFRSVDIPERRNLKLQMQHMPKRHWKHMVEMVGSV
ncbi:MAG: TIGR03915 family putative DNA repair protein [Flavobacteriales bacterium]